MLVSSIALAINSGASAQSKSSETPVLEEVIVTGIRGSLIRSMDIKRDAIGVVDAISAEDIGKFPDTNLAEAMQRITGVSISRKNGEGAQVTVRGFGADDNLVLLNGRHMPTAGIGEGDAANTRAFDFSNIASEGVSGVEVYKTSRASIATGGIGATINIKTLKPLDSPGFQFSTGIKAMHDTTNRSGDDITPEVTALISNTFDEDRIGVSFVGSYQKRDSGTVGIEQQDWDTKPWNGNDFPEATIVNAPEQGQLWSQPRNLIYQLDEIERTRINGQLTLQWRPVENLTGTLDYTYAENETSLQRYEQSVWFVASGIDRLEFDDNTIRTPVVYSESFTDLQDLSFGNIVQRRINENNSVGFNLEWLPTESLGFTLDYHDSSAETGPNDSLLGTHSKFSTAGFGIVNQTVNFDRDKPTMSVVYDDSGSPDGGNGSFGSEDIASTRGNADHADTRTDIEQLRFGGSFDFDNGSIDFGLDRREMENMSRYSSTSPVFGDWSGADPDLLPDEFFQSENFASEAGGGFSTGYIYDFQTLANWAAQQAAAGVDGFYDFNNGVFSTDREWHTNRKVEEETTSVFVQFNLHGELGGMETNVILGVRYERTDVTSTSDIQAPSVVEWQDDDDFLIRLSNEVQSITRDGSYSNVLPSLDFDIEIVQDIKARMSFSQTISRPLYSNLRAGIGSFSVNAGRAPVAQSGNPGLEPLESQNLDFSVEWYYAPGSYVSAGYYRKEVDNYVGIEQVSQSHFGLVDPTAGPRRQLAEQQLIDAGNPSPGIDEIFNRMLINEGLDPNDPTTSIVGDASKGDPLMQWLTSTPVNNKTAKMYGYELAVQHLFGDTGFGFIANYTTVDSDIEYDINSIGVTQFALRGLSDTANVVAFYDKNGWQARIAYNWRDKFLDDTAAGGLQEPGFTEEYEQIDANISYQVNDNLSVFVEGLNLTEEDTRRHGRTENQLLKYNEQGARYQIGARYTF